MHIFVLAGFRNVRKGREVHPRLRMKPEAAPQFVCEVMAVTVRPRTTVSRKARVVRRHSVYPEVDRRKALVFDVTPVVVTVSTRIAASQDSCVVPHPHAQVSSHHRSGFPLLQAHTAGTMRRVHHCHLLDHTATLRHEVGTHNRGRTVVSQFRNRQALAQFHAFRQHIPLLRQAHTLRRAGQQYVLAIMPELRITVQQVRTSRLAATFFVIHGKHLVNLGIAHRLSVLLKVGIP